MADNIFEKIDPKYSNPYIASIFGNEGLATTNYEPTPKVKVPLRSSMPESIPIGDRESTPISGTSVDNSNSPGQSINPDAGLTPKELFAKRTDGRDASQFDEKTVNDLNEAFDQFNLEHEGGFKKVPTTIQEQIDIDKTKRAFDKIQTPSLAFDYYKKNIDNNDYFSDVSKYQMLKGINGYSYKERHDLSEGVKDLGEFQKTQWVIDRMQQIRDAEDGIPVYLDKYKQAGLQHQKNIINIYTNGLSTLQKSFEGLFGVNTEHWNGDEAVGLNQDHHLPSQAYIESIGGGVRDEQGNLIEDPNKSFWDFAKKELPAKDNNDEHYYLGNQVQKAFTNMKAMIDDSKNNQNPDEGFFDTLLGFAKNIPTGFLGSVGTPVFRAYENIDNTSKSNELVKERDAGRKLTPEENLFIQTVGTHNMMMQDIALSAGYKVGQFFPDNLDYMLTFGATATLREIVGKSVVKSTFGKWLGGKLFTHDAEGVIEKGLLNSTLKAARSVGSAVAYGYSLNPISSQLYSGVQQRQNMAILSPNVDKGDLNPVLQPPSDQSKLESWVRSFYDTGWGNTSEMGGDMIDWGKGLFKNWRRVAKGLTPVSKITRQFTSMSKALGWHGTVDETFEQYLQMLGTLPDERDQTKPWYGNKQDFLDQVVPIAMMSQVMSAPNRIQQAVQWQGMRKLRNNIKENTSPEIWDYIKSALSLDNIKDRMEAIRTVANDNYFGSFDAPNKIREDLLTFAVKKTYFDGFGDGLTDIDSEMSHDEFLEKVHHDFNEALMSPIKEATKTVLDKHGLNSSDIEFELNNYDERITKQTEVVSNATPENLPAAKTVLAKLLHERDALTHIGGIASFKDVVQNAGQNAGTWNGNKLSTNKETVDYENTVQNISHLENEKKNLDETTDKEKVDQINNDIEKQKVLKQNYENKYNTNQNVEETPTNLGDINTDEYIGQRVVVKSSSDENVPDIHGSIVSSKDGKVLIQRNDGSHIIVSNNSKYNQVYMAEGIVPKKKLNQLKVVNTQSGHVGDGIILSVERNTKNDADQRSANLLRGDLTSETNDLEKQVRSDLKDGLSSDEIIKNFWDSANNNDNGVMKHSSKLSRNAINKYLQQRKDEVKTKNGDKLPGLHGFLGLGQNRKSNGFNQESNVIEKKNDIKSIHEQNPELSKIGTHQEYSEYLKTIFPNSKVQDIVYHGSTANNIKSFNKELIGSREKVEHWFGDGFYFTKIKEYAQAYGDNIYQAIVNIENPNIYGEGHRFGYLKDNENDITPNFDGSIVENGKELAVFESKNIHILGSKQDVEGFKKYKESLIQQQNQEFLSSDLKKNNSESFDMELNQIHSENENNNGFNQIHEDSSLANDSNKRPIFAVASTIKKISGHETIFYHKESDQRAGYIDNGKSYVNLAYANSDTPFHEFSHPIVEMLSIINPSMVNQLWSDIQNSEEGKAIIEKKMATGKYNDGLLKNEVIVQMLGLRGSDMITDNAVRSGLKILWNGIKYFMAKMFGVKIGMNTQLFQLAYKIKQGRMNGLVSQYYPSLNSFGQDNGDNPSVGESRRKEFRNAIGETLSNAITRYNESKDQKKVLKEEVAKVVSALKKSDFYKSLTESTQPLWIEYAKTKTELDIKSNKETVYDPESDSYVSNNSSSAGASAEQKIAMARKVHKVIVAEVAKIAGVTKDAVEIELMKWMKIPEMNKVTEENWIDVLKEKSEKQKAIHSAFIDVVSRVRKGKIANGVDFVFEQTPELLSIGTQQEYSEYLKGIFPNSEEKGILTHSSKVDLKETGFKKGFGEWSDAFFFDEISKNLYSSSHKFLYYAMVNITDPFNPLNLDNYIDRKYGLGTMNKFRKQFDLENKGEFVPKEDRVSINAQSEIDQYGFQEENPDTGGGQFIKKDQIEELQKIGYDGLLAGNYAPYTAVFEPSQIYILGSKQDFEGFKNYKESNPSKESKTIYSYDKFISLQNFYSSVHLERRIALIIRAIKEQDSNGLEVTNANEFNPELRTENALNIVNSAALKFQSYIRQVVSSAKGMLPTYQNDVTNALSAIVSEKMQDRTFNTEMVKKEMTLLSKMTGLPLGMIEKYYDDSIKNTRQQFYTKIGEKYQSIDDSLSLNDIAKLKETVYYENPSKKGTYDILRNSPMISGFIVAQRKSTESSNIIDSVIPFMNSRVGGISNIGAINLAINRGQNEMGMSGSGVLGKRFSSMVYSSDIYSSVQNLVNQIHNEELKQYYRNHEAELMRFDGIYSAINDKQQEVHKIPEQTFWAVLVRAFADAGEGDTYRQFTGQPSDKSSVFLVTTKKWDLTPENLELAKSLTKTNDKGEYRSFDLDVKYIKDLVIKNHNGIFTKVDSLLAQKFVMNFILNNHYLNEAFYGTEGKNYVIKDGNGGMKGSLIKMIKRTGTSVSPGRKLNTEIEGGVKKNFKVMYSNELIGIDELKLATEAANGLIIASNNAMKKIEISDGETYSRTKEFGNLTSQKAVISGIRVDGDVNYRDIIKGNVVHINVAMASEQDPNGIWHRLNDYLNKHDIDFLTFPSAAKEFDRSKLNNLFLNPVDWTNKKVDESGNPISVFEIKKGYIKSILSDLPKDYTYEQLKEAVGENFDEHKSDLMLGFSKLQDGQKLYHEGITENFNVARALSELFKERLWKKEFIDHESVKPIIANIPTSDYYVQQDLRHDTEPKYSDVPSQLWSNIMTFKDIFPAIASTRVNAIKGNYEYLHAIYNGFVDSEDRMQFLVDSLDPSKETDKEILNLIDQGLNENDPFIAQQIMRSMTYAISRRLLEFPVKSTTTQEFPDAMGVLMPMRKTEDGLHTRLPEIAISTNGMRVAKFFDTQEEAMDYLSANYEKFHDLAEFVYDQKDEEERINALNKPETIVPKDHKMAYTMPADQNRTGKKTTTLIQAELGNRTGTTRSYALGSKGEIITFEGKPQQYEIVDTIELTSENVVDPEFIRQWSEREQWTEKHFTELLNNPTNKTVKIGSFQTVFKKIESQQEPVQQSRNESKLPDVNNATLKPEFWQIYQDESNDYTRGKWVVPGEPYLSTRNPSGNLNAHTLGRVKFIMGEGNFTMLDRESHVRSGSDFDGDQRLSWTLDKDGTDQAKKSNAIFRAMMEQYQNVKNFDKITAPIDKEVLSKIVDKLEEKYAKANPLFDVNDANSILALNDARKNNLTGTTMKGIATNLNTAFSLLSSHNVKGIARDEFGVIKQVIDGLLNVSFDNANDPLIEKMGFNEVTANMFMYDLISHPSLVNFQQTGDYTKDYTAMKEKTIAVLEAVAKKYTPLNTNGNPIISFYVNEMRKSSSPMSKDTRGLIQKKISASTTFTDQQKNDFRRSFNGGTEMFTIKNMYAISDGVPDNAYKFANLVKQFDNLFNPNNLNGKAKMISTMNLHPILGNSEVMVPAQLAMQLATTVFHDVANTDLLLGMMRNIDNYIAEVHKQQAELEKAKKVLSEDEYTDWTDQEPNELTINREEATKLLDFVILNEALGKRQQSLKVITDRLASLIDSYHNGLKTGTNENALYSDNKFLNMLYVDRKPNGEIKRITINETGRYTELSDVDKQEIRTDFEKIPDTWKTRFVQYQLLNYGTSPSMAGGGYFDLFDMNTRIALQESFKNAKERIRLGIPQTTSLNVQLDKFIQNGKFNRMDHIKLDEEANPKIPDTALDELLSMYEVDKSNKSLRSELFGKFNLKYGTDFNQVDHLLTNLKTKFGTSLSATEVLKKEIEERKSIRDIKHFTSVTDGISQVMLDGDTDVFNNMLDHFKKMFPGVQIFDSPQQFHDFVERIAGHGMEYDYTDLGSAFANGVYLSDEATQEAVFHEFAHIYYGALADNHPVKMKLMKMFGWHEGMTKKQLSDIEELIVSNVGLSGSKQFAEKMEITKPGFLSLLKEFWLAVKSLFSEKGRKDLSTFRMNNAIQNFAYEIWTNHEGMTEDQMANIAIQHMYVTKEALTDMPADQLPLNIDASSPTTIIRMNSNDLTNREVAQRFKYNKELAELKIAKASPNYVITTDKGYDEKMESFDTYKAAENIVSEKHRRDGVAISAVFDMLNKKQLYYDSATNKVYSDELFTNDVTDTFTFEHDQKDLTFKTNFVDHVSVVKAIHDQLEEWKSKGYVVTTEQQLFNAKYGIGGRADVVLEKNGEHIIVDVKSSVNNIFDENGNYSKDYLVSKGSYKANSPLLQIGSGTKNKMNDHYAQLMIYAWLLENSGKKIKVNGGLQILPIRINLENQSKENSSTKDITISQKSVIHNYGRMQKMIVTDIARRIANVARQKNDAIQNDSGINPRMDRKERAVRNMSVNAIKAIEGLFEVENPSLVSTSQLGYEAKLGYQKMIIDTINDETFGWDMSDFSNDDKKRNIDMFSLFMINNQTYKDKNGVEHNITKQLVEQLRMKQVVEQKDAMIKRYIETTPEKREKQLRKLVQPNDNLNDNIIIERAVRQSPGFAQYDALGVYNDIIHALYDGNQMKSYDEISKSMGKTKTFADQATDILKYFGVANKEDVFAKYKADYITAKSLWLELGTIQDFENKILNEQNNSMNDRTTMENQIAMLNDIYQRMDLLKGSNRAKLDEVLSSQISLKTMQLGMINEHIRNKPYRPWTIFLHRLMADPTNQQLKELDWEWFWGSRSGSNRMASLHKNILRGRSIDVEQVGMQIMYELAAENHNKMIAESRNSTEYLSKIKEEMMKESPDDLKYIIREYGQKKTDTEGLEEPVDNSENIGHWYGRKIFIPGTEAEQLYLDKKISKHGKDYIDNLRNYMLMYDFKYRNSALINGNNTLAFVPEMFPMATMDYTAFREDFTNNLIGYYGMGKRNGLNPFTEFSRRALYLYQIMKPQSFDKMVFTNEGAYDTAKYAQFANKSFDEIRYLLLNREYIRVKNRAIVAPIGDIELNTTYTPRKKNGTMVGSLIYAAPGLGKTYLYDRLGGAENPYFVDGDALIAEAVNKFEREQKAWLDINIPRWQNNGDAANIKALRYSKQTKEYNISMGENVPLVYDFFDKLVANVLNSGKDVFSGTLLNTENEHIYKPKYTKAILIDDLKDMQERTGSSDRKRTMNNADTAKRFMLERVRFNLSNQSGVAPSKSYSNVDGHVQIAKKGENLQTLAFQKKKNFVQQKDKPEELYSELESIQRMNDSIEKLNHILKNIKENAKKFRPDPRRYRPTGTHNPYMLLHSDKVHESVIQYLNSAISNHYTAKVHPFSEFVETQHRVKFPQGNEKDIKVNESYIKEFIDTKIFHANSIDDDPVLVYKNILMSTVAIKALAFNVDAMAGNLGAGLSSDIINSEGHFIRQGIIRYAMNFKKIHKMMDDANIGTILDDVYHTKSEEYFGRFIKVMFGTTEFAEHINQGVRFANLLSKRQFDSYDSSGKLKPFAEGLSDEEIGQLEYGTQTGHGDYGWYKGLYGNNIWLSLAGQFSAAWYLPQAEWFYGRDTMTYHGKFQRGMMQSLGHAGITLYWKFLHMLPREIRNGIVKNAYANAKVNEFTKESTGLSITENKKKAEEKVDELLKLGYLNPRIVQIDGTEGYAVISDETEVSFWNSIWIQSRMELDKRDPMMSDTDRKNINKASKVAMMTAVWVSITTAASMVSWMIAHGLLRGNPDKDKIFKVGGDSWMSLAWENTSFFGKDNNTGQIPYEEQTDQERRWIYRTSKVARISQSMAVDQIMPLLGILPLGLALSSIRGTPSSGNNPIKAFPVVVAAMDAGKLGLDIATQKTFIQTNPQYNQVFGEKIWKQDMVKWGILFPFKNNPIGVPIGSAYLAKNILDLKHVLYGDYEYGSILAKKATEVANEYSPMFENNEPISDQMAERMAQEAIRRTNMEITKIANPNYQKNLGKISLIDATETSRKEKGKENVKNSKYYDIINKLSE